MYQVGKDQEEKHNKFALMFNMAVETGCISFPAMTRRECLSMRSQLNRYRVKMRGHSGTKGWDLVGNYMEQLEDGDCWILSMKYNKVMWDHLNAQLGIVNAAPQLEDGVNLFPEIQTEGVQSITDVLADMFPDTKDK